MDAFSHLVVAKEQQHIFSALLQERFGSAINTKEYLPYFLAGSIAPDGAHFYKKAKHFSCLIHQIRCVDFSQELFEQAQDIASFSFALGWLTHVEADINSHPQLIEKLITAELSAKKIEREKLSVAEQFKMHLRYELGLGCYELSKKENSWLLNLEQHLKLPEHLFDQQKFFCRAFARIYGQQYPLQALQKQWRQMFYYLKIFPWIYAALGLIERPAEGDSFREKIIYWPVRLLRRQLLALTSFLNCYYNAQVILGVIFPDFHASQNYQQYKLSLNKKIAQRLVDFSNKRDNLTLYSGQFPWRDSLQRSRQALSYYQATEIRDFFNCYFPDDAVELFSQLDSFYHCCLGSKQKKVTR